jgi:hypothetical protein
MMTEERDIIDKFNLYLQHQADSLPAEEYLKARTILWDQCVGLTKYAFITYDNDKLDSLGL